MDPSSSPLAYVTAPNSPTDFEFKAFDDRAMDSDAADDLSGKWRHRDRGDSLPAMAFADELFLNGQVMPLKLPPRLLINDPSEPNSFRRRSPPAAGTVCRLPFPRRMSSWNDDFDPFAAALEKVRDEPHRKSQHRRSRSYSPFRGHVTRSPEPNRITPATASHSHSGPLELKGSAYARWVRDQTREGIISPAISPRSSVFAKRVRPVKDENDEEDGLDNIGRSKANHNGNSKVWRFVQRWRAGGYLGRVVSFKSKSKGKKKKMTTTTMAVMEYKKSSSSSLMLCLGRGE
ncbi:uncharacterized protein LOC127258809 [Andrographis paniculata]|uniref:uncharacterized protein LOC127258809 n=1 Tax=Andrographis paniculata TaxID=175694 RepID=UPI0021E7F31F|nr:uncharacterized protein LOC127258809 [Andrographis paniculata]